MKPDTTLYETEEERLYAELRAHCYMSCGDLVLDVTHLRVKRKSPPGTGTSVMNRILRLADEHQCLVTLSVSEFARDLHSPWKQTTSLARLRRFYRRLGFESKTRKGRFDLRGSLVRYPTPKHEDKIPTTPHAQSLAGR